MELTHDVAASDPGSVTAVNLAAGASRLVGTIGELWRYPVKSMLGGTVSELLVTEQGGLGDRAWALRDQRNGRIVSAKRVPRLLEFRATYEEDFAPTLWCVGSTLAQEELPRDRSILRTIAKDHQGCLGVYGSVASPGLIRVGDPVVLAVHS